uniref:Uncharacterized protein n=1 Tax=Oryza brachyantha TaxID=4533 RepID=J3M4L0_ORYBR
MEKNNALVGMRSDPWTLIHANAKDIYSLCHHTVDFFYTCLTIRLIEFIFVNYVKLYICINIYLTINEMI